MLWIEKEGTAKLCGGVCLMLRGKQLRGQHWNQHLLMQRKDYNKLRLTRLGYRMQ